MMCRRNGAKCVLEYMGQRGITSGQWLSWGDYDCELTYTASTGPTAAPSENGCHSTREGTAPAMAGAVQQTMKLRAVRYEMRAKVGKGGRRIKSHVKDSVGSNGRFVRGTLRACGA